MYDLEQRTTRTRSPMKKWSRTNLSTEEEMVLSSPISLRLLPYHRMILGQGQDTQQQQEGAGAVPLDVPPEGQGPGNMVSSNLLGTQQDPDHLEVLLATPTGAEAAGDQELLAYW